MTTLSDRIKECLDGPPERSQIALARACGIKASSVSDWVTGKTKSINAEHIFSAAEFLNVEPKWLATGKGNKYKHDNFQDEEQPTKSESLEKAMLKKIIDDIPDEELTTERIDLFREAALIEKSKLNKSTTVLYVINHEAQEYKITYKKDKKSENK